MPRERDKRYVQVVGTEAGRRGMVPVPTTGPVVLTSTVDAEQQWVQVADEHVADDAAIAVSKLANGTERDVLRAGPTDPEWETDDPFVIQSLDVVEDAAVGGDAAVTGKVDAGGRIDVYTAQGGGWKDMLGPAVPPNSGPSIPTWTQQGASNFYGPLFAINDQLWFSYHFPHDYSPGTGIYLHVHWMTDGTQTRTVKWEMEYTYAKGHNQAAFNMTGTVVTVEQAAQGTAWRHMIAEIASAITNAAFEPDGILKVRVRRITNGGTNNTDNVFMEYCDVHYQANTFNTKNRAPDFYA